MSETKPTGPDLDKMARAALLEASGVTYDSPADEGPRYVFTTKALELLHGQAVAAERERCAKVAESRPLESGMDEWDSTAAAIRRG